MLNNSSRPRFLICSSKAVAMFMCVSSVAFRAVSSGSCVIAVFRCAALLERSLVVISATGQIQKTITYICDTSPMSLTPVDRVISAASCLYLRKVNLYQLDHHTDPPHRLSSVSMSSATCGNGFTAFFAQKKSFESRS